MSSTVSQGVLSTIDPGFNGRFRAHMSTLGQKISFQNEESKQQTEAALKAFIEGEYRTWPEEKKERFIAEMAERNRLSEVSDTTNASDNGTSAENATGASKDMSLPENQVYVRYDEEGLEYWPTRALNEMAWQVEEHTGRTASVAAAITAAAIFTAVSRDLASQEP
ncbi:uncharacterized protein IL334_007211 [Kwoniella shivajii]|uniref:Uncharacterized protein n=1 Tax=Kwoniella shivajii TaxID=564305 RepID=A0ABZ1D8U2_9TREE|nr:hypothetical protein IL334_007211 [Kwoniella shivajii]